MQNKKVKYVVVTGGVLSGLGKGLFISSLGKIIQSRGYNVVPIKIDPYVNVDAGTMNPTEHGEVYVLNDGSEVDMDLGNYERFLNIDLNSDSSITTGKIFQRVIEKERRGDYLGKTVQIVPYVTDELQHWYKKLAEDKNADVVVIEIGGTVGDIENQLFLESVRQLSLTEDVFFAHCSLVPMLGVVGEQKTKPTQQSISMLRAIGILPDMIFCRSEKKLEENIKEKISRFCGVPKDYVISGPDLKNIYEIPLGLEYQDVAEKVLKKLNLDPREKDLKDWKEFVNRTNDAQKTINIAIVGKYTVLKDSYTSIFEALIHSGSKYECKVKVHWVEATNIEEGKILVKDALKDIDGIIVPGGFGNRGTNGKMKCIKYSRENDIPFLGICFGFQLSVLEFAKNVCGIAEANSTELDQQTIEPVIDIMADQKNIHVKGGTMRLGSYDAILKINSIIKSLYGKTEVTEKHRHRFEVNNKYKEILEENGMLFSGTSPDEKLMEFLEIPNKKFFVATQGHPELSSRPLKTNPMFDGLVEACIKNTTEKTIPHNEANSYNETDTFKEESIDDLVTKNPFLN
ncbi:CTP synthase [Candidatus Pacearchaeota archaeon]|nr:CTP synthase [Candidatus Pacearchaeota archaeon]